MIAHVPDAPQPHLLHEVPETPTAHDADDRPPALMQGFESPPPGGRQPRLLRVVLQGDERAVQVGQDADPPCDRETEGEFLPMAGQVSHRPALFPEISPAP